MGYLLFAQMGLQWSDMAISPFRRLTNFNLSPLMQQPAGGGCWWGYQRVILGGRADMLTIPDFRFTDNPPITYLHQLLTPLPARALLFATLPAYSLTGKRVGGVR